MDANGNRVVLKEYLWDIMDAAEEDRVEQEVSLQDVGGIEPQTLQSHGLLGC